MEEEAHWQAKAKGSVDKETAIDKCWWIWRNNRRIQQGAGGKGQLNPSAEEKNGGQAGTQWLNWSSTNYLKGTSFDLSTVKATQNIEVT